MTIYVSGKTIYPKSVIDFLEVETSDGRIHSLDWDESEYDFGEDGSFSARLKGVYIDKKYANGCLLKLAAMKITHVEFCSEEKNKVNPCDEINFLEYVDGESRVTFEKVVYRRADK